MKVLLTGYSGFLGRYLARALKREGFSIRVLLHRHTLLKVDLSNEVDEVLWGSLDDDKILKKAVSGVQIIIHSGWQFSSPNMPRPTINEKATELLFQESVNSSVQAFVFVSSVAVYGMKSEREAVNESSILDAGGDAGFIYPSEKIRIERFLKTFDKKNTKLGIFRPGPIFDDTKGPMKKIIRIAGNPIGIGLGGGRNHMAYIHAEDVASAIVLWLKVGEDNSTFNVTPTFCLSYRDWFRAWGLAHGMNLKAVFIPSPFIRLASLGAKIIKSMLKKRSKGDVNYAISCATRDKCYSNESLKSKLGWNDDVTIRYTRHISKRNGF